MEYLTSIIELDNIIDNLKEKRKEEYNRKIELANNIFKKYCSKLNEMNLQIQTKSQYSQFLTINNSNVVKFCFNKKFSNGIIIIEVENNKKTIEAKGKFTKSEIDEAVRIVNKILKEG